VHGLTLLADPWLHPGIAGVTVPFAMGYRPAFTGLGILAAYLAALLGLSFYARRRIGARLWRRAHRATVLVYALGIVHTLGAGSDASAPWLRMFVVVTGAPILMLFVRRVAVRRPARRAVPAAEGAPP
jgi:sulfoxide reductase heme-binding subunit YedZ